MGVEEVGSSPPHSDIQTVDAVEEFKLVFFFTWNGDIFHTVAKIKVIHPGVDTKRAQ